MPTDDNPLFDDEYLPDWLQNAGLNNSDQQQSSASKPPQKASEDDNLPWLNKNAASSSGAPSQDDVAFDDDISIPWQVDSAPPPGQKPGASGSGLTGALPWRQGTSDPVDKPGGQFDDPFAALDALNAAIPPVPPSESSQNLRGLMDFGSSVGQAAPPVSAEPLPALPDDLDWLNSSLGAEQPDSNPLSFMPSAPLAPDAEQQAPPSASSTPSGLMSRLGKSGAAAPTPPPTPVTLPSLDDAIPDWFNTPEPQAQETAPADDQVVPDWLSAGASADVAASDPGVSDLLDWMSQQPAPAGTATPPPPADQSTAMSLPSDFDWLAGSDADAAPVSGDDIPAWMREAAPLDATPAPAAVEPGGDMDWLTDFADDPSGGMAGWPTDETAASTAPIADFAPPPSGEGHIDIDALLSLAPSAPTIPDDMPMVPSAGPMIPVNSSDQALTTLGGDISLDDLFMSEETAAADNDAAAASSSSFAIPAPEPPKSGIVELPPLEPSPQAPMRRLPLAPQPSGITPIPAPPPAQAGAAQPGTPLPSNKPQEELPDWVSEMRPAEAPISLRIGDQEVHIVEKPSVQLNDDLRRIRDRSRAMQQQTKQQASKKPPTDDALAVGPLAGITGAIEAIPTVVQEGTTSAASQIVASDAQMRRARLIQKILESEDQLLQDRMKAEDALADQTEAIAAPRSRAGVKLDRLVITLLLTVVIVAPFFVKNLGFIPAPDTSQLTPLQAAVASKVDALQAGQPVLVAFEYGPTGSGELDELAKVALQDIIQHKAHPVLVSTNPAGAMHAETLMAGLAALSTPPLVARQDYVVLRYLPGGSAGVRAAVDAILNGGLQQQIVFATDIEGKPSGLSPETIDALKNNPAFILTESQEDVRNWAEQYKSAAADQPLPMIFLSSVGASAVADTYVHTASQRIFGPLVGLRDAMIYGTARQIVTTSSANAAKAQQTADQRWQSIGLGTLTATVLILIGAAINLIRSLPRRRRR